MTLQLKIVTAIVLLFASCVTPCLRTEGKIIHSNDAEVPGSQITVVTLNVLHGFGSRLNDRTLDLRTELLIGEMTELDPDIILLQEVSATPGGNHCNVVDTITTGLNSNIGQERKPYSSIFKAAHGSHLIGFYEGSAVISRFPIREVETVVFAVQAATPSGGRYSTSLDLRPRGGGCCY